MSFATKSVPVYSVQIRDRDDEFKLKTEVNKPEKRVFLELPNLKIKSYRIIMNI